MKITLLEPFFTGSHRRWAEELQQHSCWNIDILSLKGRHWKWRMYGGAVTLAEKFIQQNIKPDLIIASDLLDLTTFLALTKHLSSQIPTAVYFHENQITYPWSPNDEDVILKRNNQYGFINYTSALVADKVFFNSHYHKNSFLKALPNFLKQFPDYRGLHNIDTITTKSEVLHLGMDLRRFLPFREVNKPTEPVLLWNHRWEYDKNPDAFFHLLFRLKEEGIAFKLVVLGESFQKVPPIFEEAKKRLADEILHFGYAESFEAYAHWLWMADVLPVTSNQDFFGGSVVEAIYCGCYPLLPKRLAYPEHIPIEEQKQHCYKNEEDLYFRLKEVLENKERWRKHTKFQNFVGKYDWRSMIDVYDEAFEQMVNLNKTKGQYHNDIDL